MIRRTTRFISNLSKSTIRWPNADEKNRAEEYFRNTKQIPGVIGAIDGTHIIIDPPKNKRDDYIDRKGDISICLQGICNEDRKFIDVFIGFPGCSHDSRVFKASDIYYKLPHICKDYWLLGDSAYPVSNYVLTPFRDNGHLTAVQRNYNRIHSSARVIIEHTFGILKQRFRQLYYSKLKGVEHICHFIRACCVLHNMADQSDLDCLEDLAVSHQANEDDDTIGNNDDIDNEDIPICAWSKRIAISQQLYNRRS